jgi:hypothetical protein
MSVTEWRQAAVAGVPLRRFTGHVGDIEVGFIEYDGSNRLWTWVCQDVLAAEGPLGSY